MSNIDEKVRCITYKILYDNKNKDLIIIQKEMKEKDEAEGRKVK